MQLPARAALRCNLPQCIVRGDSAIFVVSSRFKCIHWIAEEFLHQWSASVANCRIVAVNIDDEWWMIASDRRISFYCLFFFWFTCFRMLADLQWFFDDTRHLLCPGSLKCFNCLNVCSSSNMIAFVCMCVFCDLLWSRGCLLSCQLCCRADQFSKLAMCAYFTSRLKLM